MSKKDFEFEFCNEKEIRNLIKSKAELFYADDGMTEVIVRFEDIPDFIVDYNKNFGSTDLKFFKVGKDVYETDITTIGMFLNRIKPELRERMIDRLVALQRNEIKTNKIKIVDEDMHEEIEEKMKQETRKLKGRSR